MLSLLPLVSSGTYNDCGVYGNCISQGVGGATSTNATYTNVSYINATYNDTVWNETADAVYLNHLDKPVVIGGNTGSETLYVKNTTGNGDIGISGIGNANASLVFREADVSRARIVMSGFGLFLKIISDYNDKVMMNFELQNGNIDVPTGNLTTPNWFIGKLNWSDVQNAPTNLSLNYNMTVGVNASLSYNQTVVGQAPYLYNLGLQMFFNETKNNATINDKLKTIFYNVTEIANVSGSTQGTLPLIQIYDNNAFNVTSATSSPGMDFRLNFTGVDTFNRIIFRTKDLNTGSLTTTIYLWDYAEGIWESYAVLSELIDYTVKEIGVYDATDHISGGVVQMRFLMPSPGNTNRKHMFDWVSLAQGSAMPSGAEVDPYSFHKGENITADGTNISADYYFGDGSKLTNISSSSYNASYVPYTGATADVDLGVHNLKVNAVSPFAGNGNVVVGNYLAIQQMIGTYATGVNSIDANNRILYASDGADAVLNWNTVGTADFGDDIIKTTGTLLVNSTNANPTDFISSSTTTYIDLDNTNTGTTGFRYLESGSARWLFGSDGADADKFKVSASSTFASNNAFSITRVTNPVTSFNGDVSSIGNISANWFFGKLNWSDIQSNPYINHTKATYDTYMGQKLLTTSSPVFTALGIGENPVGTVLSVTGGQTYLHGSYAYAPLYIAQSGAGPSALFTGGNVGIGTISPDAPLTVIGNSNVTGNLKIIGNLSVTGNINATRFNGLTDADNIITPIAVKGTNGMVDAFPFGNTQQVYMSDTDARYWATFNVRKGGSFKAQMGWYNDATNTAKTMSGLIYSNKAVSGQVIAWDLFGSNWDLAIPDTAFNYTQSTFGTAMTISDNSYVAVLFAKDDNAGGASGNLSITDMVLVRQ